MKNHVKKFHQDTNNNNEQQLEIELNELPQELRPPPKFNFEIIEHEGLIFLLTANQNKMSLSQLSNTEDTTRIKDTKCQTIPFTCTGIHGLGGKIVVFGSTNCLVTNVNGVRRMVKYFLHYFL